MCAAILNHTKDRVPSFQTQNVAKKDCFPSVSNGLLIKTLTHIYLWEMRENFRTVRKKVPKELKYLELPCPKFTRGRQTANVTTGVCSRDSLTFAVMRIQKQT